MPLKTLEPLSPSDPLLKVSIHESAEILQPYIMSIFERSFESDI